MVFGKKVPDYCSGFYSLWNWQEEHIKGKTIKVRLFQFLQIKDMFYNFALIFH